MHLYKLIKILYKKLKKDYQAKLAKLYFIFVGVIVLLWIENINANYIRILHKIVKEKPFYKQWQRLFKSN